MEEMNALSPSTTRDRSNRTCRTLDRHRFENEELEALFYRYDAKIRKSWVFCLIVILIILSVCLSIVGFIYYRSATAQNVFLAIQCGACLCLLVFINTKWLTEGKLLVVCWIIYAMCLVFCVISLPVDFGDRHGTRLSAADGVWETALIVFLVYAFLPFKFYIALGTGIFLPVVHLIVSVLMTTTGFSELLWRTVCILCLSVRLSVCLCRSVIRCLMYEYCVNDSQPFPYFISLYHYNSSILKRV